MMWERCDKEAMAYLKYQNLAGGTEESHD